MDLALLDRVAYVILCRVDLCMELSLQHHSHMKMPQMNHMMRENWAFDGDEQRQDHAVLFVLSSQS